MNIIMPAGTSEVKWSPVAKNENPMTKTASSDDKEAQAPQDDKDILFEVAKKVIEEREAKAAKAETKIVEAEEEKEACGDVVAEEDCDDSEKAEDCDDSDDDGGEAPFEKSEDDSEEAGEDEAPCEDGELETSAVETIQEGVAELAEQSEAAEAAVEKAQEAVEQIADVVEEVKAELGGSPTEDAIEEVVEEDPIGNDEAVIEVDTIEEIPGEPDLGPDESDMIVESREPMFASTEDMVKLSKLSPENKSKISEYWKGFFPEAADWVDLLTKDYEK